AGDAPSGKTARLQPPPLSRKTPVVAAQTTVSPSREKAIAKTTPEISPGTSCDQLRPPLLETSRPISVPIRRWLGSRGSTATVSAALRNSPTSALSQVTPRLRERKSPP